MVDKKIKLNVTIDVYDNGSGVLVKDARTRKVLGARLFLSGQEKEMKVWLDSFKETVGLK